MRAMLLDRQAPIGTRPLEWCEVEAPRPGSQELLVRVSVCAVCRTDLHVIEGDLPARRLPLIPGHQIVGVVEARGANCERFAVGDRVGIGWLRRTCGRCDDCAAGRENLCRSSRYTGYHADGGYAELTVVPEAFAYGLPGSMPDAEVAPLLCAGIIGFRALARAELPPGGRLGLFGFGSSAHVVLQLARHRGAEVLVATRGENHRRMALDLGAAWVGQANEPMPRALDAAIVFAPAGAIVPLALERVRPGATVALAGIHMSRLPEMDYERCLFHEKNLRSVEANTRLDGVALLREAARVPIRPRVVRYRLAEANEVLIGLAESRIDGTAVLSCPA